MNTNRIIEAKISDIKTGDRFRKDFGDLEELARSIEEVGLLHPIGITPDHELIFGERRLRACGEVLGRETISARIVSVKSVLDGQITENSLRKDFTISERVAIVKALRSFSHGGDRRSEQARQCEDETLTVDEAAKRVGFSKDSYYRANEAVEKGIPQVVEAMDSGKLSINAAHKLAQAAPDEQEECLTKTFDEGKATARSVKKNLRRIRQRKEREELLARAVETPQRDEDIQIHHCRFQELEELAGLEPESVPLICTDIPYGNDFVGQIEELAAFAKRLLVPGGTFVAYVGQHRLNEKLRALDKHLTYQWVNSAVWEGPANDVPRLKLVSKSIPLVVYSKGRWRPPNKWLDTFITKVREKDWHPWQRPLEEVEKLVGYFSKPGDLVVDPCGGGFTTAIACLRNHRRFIGCDADKAAVVKGQERLKAERSEPVILPMKPVLLNSVTQGDCRDLIPMLPDESVSLCATSPPYADQRKGKYPGVPEQDYPAFTVDWMSKLWDKLTDDGSVLIIVDPHVKNGVIADYVLRTRLALREFGWKEHMPQIWFKKDRCPMGHREWPRHVYEQILWFSKTAKPFCDPWVCGTPSKRVGSPSYKHSEWSNGKSPDREGTARVTDVIAIPAGATEKGIDHPAMFPIPLAEYLIETFCPKGGTVLDPFAGSGTTLLAAAHLGRRFYGFDIVPEYAEVARTRLSMKRCSAPPTNAATSTEYVVLFQPSDEDSRSVNFQDEWPARSNAG